MSHDYEVDCGHEECLEAYVAEVARVGFEAAEDLCIEEERAEDARAEGAAYRQECGYGLVRTRDGGF